VYFAIVCYWSNRGLMKYITGHLALKLFGPDLVGSSGERGQCFVNWAPLGRREGGNIHGTGPHRKVMGPGMIFARGTHDKNRFAFQNDVDAMGGHQPNKTVNIFSLQDNSFGLDIKAMHTWWKVFSHAASTNWSMAKRNCASVVAKCLMAGGAAAYAKPPKVPIWTPQAVYSWSKQVRDKIDKLNASAKAVMDRRQMADRDFHRTPWSVEEFKKKSSAGRFATRYSELKAIDSALGAFHSLPLSQRDRNSFEDKIGAVGSVMVAIHEQLVTHPDSKRLTAVVTLGMQLLWSMKELEVLRSKLFEEQAREEALQLPQPQDAPNPWREDDFSRSADDYYRIYQGERAPDHDDRILRDANYRVYALGCGIL